MTISHSKGDTIESERVLDREKIILRIYKPLRKYSNRKRSAEKIQERKDSGKNLHITRNQPLSNYSQ